MHCPRAIGNNIYWIGVNDRSTDLFESLWPLPHGISYNSYLINDAKVAVIDAVKDDSTHQYMAGIESVIGSEKPVDFLVVNHMEPDHSGLIMRLLERWPGLTVVGNRKTLGMLGEFYGLTTNLREVADGEELKLGQHTLQFHLTPMVHWPETMMSYEPHEQILFAGDAFGSFGALDGGIFDDEIEPQAYREETVRYFSNIIGKYSKMVQNALGKLSSLPLKVIASTHGPIWRTNPGYIVDVYDRLSRQVTVPGITLVYGSMYKNTESMMEAVACGAVAAGVESLKIHDVSRSHLSYIIRDAWQYQGLILGAPTYDTGVFPAMDSLLRRLEGKKLGPRSAGVFGTYGWSGGGVKQMLEFTERMKMNVVAPAVEACCRPTRAELAACHELGRKVGEAVQHGAG